MGEKENNQGLGLSPSDFYLIKIMWLDLNIAAHKQTLAYLNELKRRCREERTAVSPQRSDRLAVSHRNCFLRFTVAKSVSTGY